MQSYQNSRRSASNLDEEQPMSFRSSSQPRAIQAYAIVATGVLVVLGFMMFGSSTSSNAVSAAAPTAFSSMPDVAAASQNLVASTTPTQSATVTPVATAIEGASLSALRPEHIPEHLCDHCRPEFHGKVVLVTGGSTGIGYSTVLNFAQKGAKVVFCGRNKTRGYESLEMILSDPIVQIVHGFSFARESDIRRRDVMKHQPVAFLPADISIQQEVKSLIQGVVDLYGTLDIAVNNAGVLGYAGPLTGVPDDIFGSPADVLQVNMYGTLFSVLEELRLWESEAKAGKRKQGVIVNIASVEGKNGFPGTSIYASSKFAVVGLTKSVAGEYVEGANEFGLRVRINAIAPGAVDTPMVWDSARLYFHDKQEWEGDRITTPKDEDYVKYKKEVLNDIFPGGRIGSPQDVADAVLFLSSHKADFISGSVLTVDNTLTSTVVPFRKL